MARKDVALDVSHVSMRFNLSSEKVDNLKEYIVKSIKKEIHRDEFWALKDVSFTLRPGDRLGILGLNGAGKSTLLKVIAGVFKPTKGKVIKKGIMAPMLELGAGFDPQYTGEENIYLYGSVLGLSKDFLKSSCGKFTPIWRSPIKAYMFIHLLSCYYLMRNYLMLVYP